MKALSIIGIIMSAILVFISFIIINIRCSHDNYSSEVGVEPGFCVLVIALFFLAFSIVATVVSFKKKSVAN